MFDVGFLELFVIGVIALIVLGPERLPKAARTVGLWVGKAKQGFNSMKTEIDRELKVQELQQQIKAQKDNLAEQAGINNIHESLNEAQQSLNEMHSDLKQAGEKLASKETSDKKQSNHSE